MKNSGGMQRPVALLGTVTGAALVVLGVGILIWGTALYDAGALAFPVLAQIAIVAGETALGTVPGLFLLRAVQAVRRDDLTRARIEPIVGGLLLLPGIGIATLFKLLANPCWDNPTCTGGSSFEDGVLKVGILVVMFS